jgi:hypothetical protein
VDVKSAPRFLFIMIEISIFILGIFCAILLGIGMTYLILRPRLKIVRNIQEEDLKTIR